MDVRDGYAAGAATRYSGLLYSHRTTGACSTSFLARSAGFVGISDGWQDLAQHHALHWQYDSAQDGHVALTGEIDLSACGGEFALALGFGRHPEEAALRVRASLCDELDEAIREYVTGWQEWQDGLLPLDWKLPTRDS
jgi:glucoamylase